MQILLIRHGQPKFTDNPKLSAAGFAQWVSRYNHSTIDSAYPPPSELSRQLQGRFVVTSDLTRSVDSAILCAGRKPDMTLKTLREMDIPRFNWPLSLKANTWLYISRTCWFFRVNGNVESFSQAKLRAELTAQQLISLTEQHGNLAVFGHGLMNRFITKQLRLLGWTGPKLNNANAYWGHVTLQLNHHDNEFGTLPSNL